MRRTATTSPAMSCCCRALVRRKAEEPEDWTEPYDAPSAAETELAKQIADEIAAIRGTSLPSGKRLARRRDPGPGAQARRLRRRDEPRAPRARTSRRPAPTAFPVATHIAVLDLLALADVMLLPEDDLQLAALLKSPLIGLERGGADAARGRSARRSLWRALRDDGRHVVPATRRRGSRAGAAWPTR